MNESQANGLMRMRSISFRAFQGIANACRTAAIDMRDGGGFSMFVIRCMVLNPSIHRNSDDCAIIGTEDSHNKTTVHMKVLQWDLL